MEDGLHVAIGTVERLFVKRKIVLAVVAHASLVEDAQNLIQTVVNLAVKARYLNDDAVVVQTVDELVGNAAGYRLVLVVESMMADIDHRLLYLAYCMAKQIDGNHGKGMPVGAVADHVLRILVVNAKILAETKQLRGQPRLLQLYQYELLLTVGLKHRGAEVDAENGEYLFLPVGVLVRAHLHFHDVLLQQSREYRAGYALVLHEVLEHGVVDGVGYRYHNCWFCRLQS